MSVAPSHEPSLVNRSFRHFYIEKFLGEGGMGVVYEAFHQRLGTRVAIKFLKEQYIADASAVERFFLEPQALAKLRGHPNIPDVYEVDADPRHYFVMQLITGETLAARIQREKTLPLPEILRIAKALTSALEAAHVNQLVHRDLKAENIMLADPLGLVKLLDFGIVRRIGKPTFTTKGSVLGTPGHMAPEQSDEKLSHQVGPAADIFCLGLVLFEMSTGRSIFSDGKWRGYFVHARLSLRVPGLAEELRPLIRSMLRPKSSGRPSARKVLDELVAVENRIASVNKPEALPSKGTISGANGEVAGPLGVPAAERPTRRASKIALRAVAVATVCVVAAVPAARSELRKREQWARIRQAHELHDRASTSLPKLVQLDGGKAVELGRPPAWIDAQIRSHEGWPPAIFQRQELRYADIPPYELMPTEVTWAQFCDWLNELLLLDMITLDRETTDSHAFRYVKDLDGHLMVDLDASTSGIEFDEAGHRFRVHDRLAMHPAELLSWDTADRFCSWYGMRLPTSNEREFAARGRTTRLYPKGTDEHDPLPRCEDGVADRDHTLSPSKGDPGARCGYLHEPGSQDVRFKLNDETPEHIFDLYGNVSEYVSDRCMNPSEPEQVWSDWREAQGANYTSVGEMGMAGFRVCVPRYIRLGVDNAIRGFGLRCAR